MILDKHTLHQLEQSQMKVFDEAFKAYLLTAYGQEPFPYVYSEQDLFEQICKDLAAYEKGELDLIMDPAKHWQQEQAELQRLCSQQEAELQDQTIYVNELEQILSSNNLESSRMTKKKLDDTQEGVF